MDTRGLSIPDSTNQKQGNGAPHSCRGDTEYPISVTTSTTNSNTT